MDEWPVQDAKARFSELLETVEKRGPQLITKRGVKTAVLVPIEEWRHLKGERPKNIKELLLGPEPRFDDLQIPDRKSYKWRKPPRF